jgi:hypothetical protein
MNSSVWASGDSALPELVGLAAGLALGGLAGMSLRMFGIELDGTLLTQAGVACAAVWLAVTVSRI